MATRRGLNGKGRKAPTIESGKVPPRRQRNKDVRPREHLTPREVRALATAAGNVGRHRHRDKFIVQFMYRHGLRVGELVRLQWDAVNLADAELAVARLKNGKAGIHPLTGDDVRALRRIRRDYPASPWIFTTERGGPLTTSTVRKLIARAGRNAGLAFPAHPHQLRHARGYRLANAGHDLRAIQAYLGHRNVQHTTRYTEMAQGRFKGFAAD